ncbi:MAG: NAD-glutamate dehydrogenase domain-containing protein, partial [Gammaproteobacteria bacterium]
VLDGRVENDALNKLIVLTGMVWQEVDVLRAYRNYYLQLGLRTTHASIHHALIQNPSVSQGLFNYFDARFRPNSDWSDPVLREEQALFPLRLLLLDSMESVADINDDRILRTLFNLIDSTMRSNYHMRLNRADYFIAFKTNSLGVIDMPFPKPQYEIYVHAVDMEGIHLRAGKVSRGGIRWSDRPDDFRTEILDLMLTQTSKNALIVPTGAKGGFVVKTNASRADYKKAGKEAYIRLIKALLDLTDNYEDNQVVRPEHLVVYDDPDPYLVVAADKGTAQFSDIANSESADYRFWLGDAFASGGSRGYNHKSLGITARGAWECVKRHFREMGKDIQNEVFTVVGIGSMDGDVFGNGMLLSPHTRLLAAFSGQHIFIDPTPPDQEAPFQERKRLFELPGSTWDDYDRSLISKGGGVYLRSAKDIPVSSELKKWLGIRYKFIDGESLIRYLLSAPVDLLWLGGIGTYIKSSIEKHEEVGDRANDNVRVDACDIKAKVVGEGANLGFTQKARIEYSLLGGRINTDAVDNSAGVDTSDHEVNLKILLTTLQRKHLISGYDQLFVQVTDEICRLVLADNYAQSLCLSLEQHRSARNPEYILNLAERLENSGFFDRTAEDFPQTKEVLSRPGRLITRPELAVLMSASKMFLTQKIKDQSALLEDACCRNYLLDYFPDEITQRFKKHLSLHPLANEIKATLISNKIINQAGFNFINLDPDNKNSEMCVQVSSFLTFDRVVEGDKLRQGIYALDCKIAAEIQYELLLKLEKMLTAFCLWALMENRTIWPNDATVEWYRRCLKDYENYFGQLEANPDNPAETLLKRYLEAGVPKQFAEPIVFISRLENFPLIVDISSETGEDLAKILTLSKDLENYLGLDKIGVRLKSLSLHDFWEQKAIETILEDIKIIWVRLIKKLLPRKIKKCADYFERPQIQNKIVRYRRIYQEIENITPVNLLSHVILIKELEKLAETD